ncbi:MAG: hypothetical protein KJZ65_06620 [Phycisphaerales bacterium]|nr:hypothetical protein [Phycisphaerales bacterium]
MPKYRIMGAWEDSGDQVSVEIDVADEAKAAMFAERRRIMVRRIVPMDVQPEERGIVLEADTDGRTTTVMTRGPVVIEQERAMKVAPGEILRKRRGQWTSVPPEEVELGDLVHGRHGYAYLRVDQRGLFWTIVWAFVVGNFMLWFVLALIGLTLYTNGYSPD